MNKFAVDNQLANSSKNIFDGAQKYSERARHKSLRV